MSGVILNSLVPNRTTEKNAQKTSGQNAQEDKRRWPRGVGRKQSTPREPRERLKQLEAECMEIDPKAKKLSKPPKLSTKWWKVYTRYLNTAVGFTREIIGPNGTDKVDRIVKGKNHYL